MVKRKQKQKRSTSSESVVYYAARVGQRVSLLLAAGSTIVLWAAYISVTISLSATSQIRDVKFEQPELLSSLINKQVNALSTIAGSWAIIAFVASAALIMLPRVRKYEKSLIIDGVVISSFCLCAVLFIEPIIRAFLVRVN